MSDAEAAWTQWWYEKWPDGTEPKAKKAFIAGYRQSLLDAADAIQALHPGEVKASVEFLRERAARLDRATKENNHE